MAKNDLTSNQNEDDIPKNDFDGNQSNAKEDPTRDSTPTLGEDTTEANKTELIKDSNESTNPSQKGSQEDLNNENNVQNQLPSSEKIPPILVRASYLTTWGCLKWLLLLFIIFLFLFLFIKMCSGGQGGATILPPQSGIIVPIDSAQVVIDPDSIKSIVANRLNIALIGQKKSIPDFATAFKEAYPDDQYQVIYYDTLTYRLQVQIPDSLREFMIEDMPKKLKEFEMLVWHESLFNRNKFPTDPGFKDNDKKWYFKAVQADQIWDKTYGKNNIIIAIIDDGFDISHPEFKDKIVKPWNVCEKTVNVMTNTRSYHGTHVAGTATGVRDNNGGMSGIAPDCKLMPIQVGDRNGLISSTAVIDAVLYAINQGANVINLSLGLAVDDVVKSYPLNVQQDIINNSYKEEEAFWDKIFKMADAKNVTIILAGGNQDVLIGIDPMQRNRSGIKVSAIDPNGEKASFSNFGKYSTISAPGVHIYNSIPGNRYDYLDGTSMAAPIVTGGIALIKSLKPDISNRDLIELIQKTGKPINSPGRKIGPLLQLDKAIGPLPPSDVSCPDIKSKIDSLQNEIERLKELCPDGVGEVDTMKMPPKGDDINFSVGRWRSTTYIHNNSGEKITIYFDFFADKTGKITLVEPDNTQCTADLNLVLKSPMLLIDQQIAAICKPPPTHYTQYKFSCQPDANGCAECTAQNKRIKANRFKFKLIKVK
jgi:subtilisin family serine protease